MLSQPGSTLTATLFPDTTLFRAVDTVHTTFWRIAHGIGDQIDDDAVELDFAADQQCIGVDIVLETMLPLRNRPGFLDRALDQHRRRQQFVAHTRMSGFEPRSEEHTSELQSLMRNSYAFFRLQNTNTH